MIADYIAQTRYLPFQWGVCDCCMWAAGYVKDATGTDPMADLRGAYDSAFTARQVRMRHGGIVAMTGVRMGFLPAGRDVVIAEWRGQTLAALMIGDLMFLKSPKDVLMTRDYKVLKGWAV
jgi:hypothetical protein